MRHIVSAALAVATCAAMVGGAAVATSAVVGPRSDPPAGVPAAAPRATNTAPTPTFVPNPASSVYTPIGPCRVVDTATKGGLIHKGKTRSFYVRGTTGFVGQGGKDGGCGIPTTATAVAVTITTLHQTARGSLKDRPASSSGSYALAASFTKKTQNSTGATLTLGGGVKDLTFEASGAATDVIVDVTGYYDIEDHLIILADGTVWYGHSHITELIHTSGTGSYTLVFPRSLAGCNVLTTDNDQANVQVVGSWGGSSLSVTTSVESGGVYTPTDEGFQVFVVC